ncbi:PEST proteolytic signal-containing nuclear protein-like isoform X2 [Dreissena polymorpha]|uniref:PEST proteolytic signal-containing nuclear protein-like isoform X2 n=1 Tax=Dreissena polymorpha TaxID=45954 RepID=UPI0022654AE8|nr:PEST proteolytic signal-containing nuclear protein-like isoform X2 [Dreissena polymorpha]
MASVGSKSTEGRKDGDNSVSPQKRKADNEGEAITKKASKDDKPSGAAPINVSVGKKPGGISMNLGGSKKLGVPPIKMSLPAQVQKTEVAAVKPKNEKIASVFNPDSESDEEEMPFEAKMRMRNVGRETPTAAGPNSFGKGNLGFCDRNKMIERDLQKQMEQLGEKADSRRPKT